VIHLLIAVLLAQPLPPGPAERRLAGCYELTVGSPVPPTRPEHFEPIPPPRRFELLLAPIDGLGASSGRELRPLTSTVYGLSLWRWEARNTIRMAWSTGFIAVVVLTDRTTDHGFSGHAAWHSDAGPSGQTASVSARRIPCK
jgi:hypothetical protein